MSLTKVVADFSDRALAYQTGAMMQDFLEPAPDALTIFENGAAGWRVEAYFSDGGDVDALNALLPDLIGGKLPRFVAEAVPDLNWVAISQAALPPVHAGRFTIHGSHDAGVVARGPRSILIDAGEAFGTAHHATTLGCLMAIDRLTRSFGFDTVLDLGCGSGVLAIAVAKTLPGAEILATDMDVQSVNVARANARLNGVGSRIAFAVAAGVDHAAFRGVPPFDLVIANILAGPLVMLAPKIARHVAPGGTLVLSGILIPQAPEVMAAYRTAGFAVQRHDRIVGWSTLTLIKR